MNKLSKGTRIKILLITDKVKTITINFENGGVKETIISVKEPPLRTEITEDLPILENYNNIDVRLAYIHKNRIDISDKIKNARLTKQMILPSDKCIEIKLYKDVYLIETESKDYYVEILNQGN